MFKLLKIVADDFSLTFFFHQPNAHCCLFSTRVFSFSRFDNVWARIWDDCSLYESCKTITLFYGGNVEYHRTPCFETCYELSMLFV